MLVLMRKIGESIILTTPSGESIQVKVIDTRSRGRKVRLGIEATSSICIDREEVFDRKMADRAAARAIHDTERAATGEV